jgi:hypothetical protein
MLGVHEEVIGGQLKKTTIDPNGNILSFRIHDSKEATIKFKMNELKDTKKLPDYNDIKKCIQGNCGCHIQGNIMINKVNIFYLIKVPGNVHITTSPFKSILKKLSDEKIYNIDISHEVKHLSFGSKEKVDHINKVFYSQKSTVTSLKNKKKELGIDYNKNYEYYMKV